MIRKIINKVFQLPRRAGRRLVIPQKKHGISPQIIIEAGESGRTALSVVEKLQKHGFSAYIVGGAVRDILLNLVPKDFDVATNATPEQVHHLFGRKSRIIGKRFRIVHILAGRDVIEVSTFRAPPKHHQTDTSGRIIQDNTFGTEEEDANRRDFSANALYYDPIQGELIDYHQGLQALAQKTLKMIGTPKLRYEEDPVRMLRAIRLSSKLNLTLDAASRAPIAEMAGLLGHVPAARRADEMLKILLCGHAEKTVHLLHEAGLFKAFFIPVGKALALPEEAAFIYAALRKTDTRIRENQPISVGFILASLLWFLVRANWKVQLKQQKSAAYALQLALEHTTQQVEYDLSIPRRYTSTMREIWLLQSRFLNRAGKRPEGLIEHPRFRAAYDFFLLRAEHGDEDPELAQWWTAYYLGSPEERATLQRMDTQGGLAAKKRRRRPVRRKATSGRTE